jgi:biotin transport system substrate-specific component
MLAASWMTGVLGAGRGLIGRVAAMLVGVAAIYALGALWLALYIPSSQLLMKGILPFVLADLIKIGIVAAGASLVSGISRPVKPAG